MKKIFLTLRYMIPAITLLFVIISFVIGYFITSEIIINQSIENNQNKLKDRLNFLQGIVEDYNNKNNTLQIQRLISSIASEPDIKGIQYVDPKGIIVASNHYDEINSTWSDPENIVKLNNIQNSILEKHAHVILNKKNHILLGFTHICKKSNSLFRTSNCGFLYFRINLRYDIKNEKENIFYYTSFVGMGLLIGAILLNLALSKLITSRTSKINHYLNRFSAGERDFNIPLSGKDEISQMSHTINKLLQLISKSEKELQSKEESLRAVVNTMIDGLITINDRGIIQSFNPAAENLFGYTQSETIGQNVNILMSEPNKSQHDNYIHRYLTTNQAKIIGIGREIEALRKDGTTFPAHLGVSKMIINGQIFFTGIIRDISKEKNLENILIDVNEQLKLRNEELVEISITDPLTGLYNRRFFDMKLQEELHRSLRQKTSLSLILCDIDYFKLYNDHYGHQEGDECLRFVSQLIKRTFRRSGEVPARYGGEEFSIILPNLSQDEAFEIANTLRNLINTSKLPHEKSKVADHVTLSMGISTYTPSPDESEPITPKELINLADENLYLAKERGRNQIVS